MSSEPRNMRILKNNICQSSEQLSRRFFHAIETEKHPLPGALEVYDQGSPRLSVPHKIRKHAAIFHPPDDFLARPARQLHVVEILRDVDVAIDESEGSVRLVKLH